jgi:hypothetical protein
MSRITDALERMDKKRARAAPPEDKTPAMTDDPVPVRKGSRSNARPHAKPNNGGGQARKSPSPKRKTKRAKSRRVFTVKEWKLMESKRRPVRSLVQQLLPDQAGEYIVIAGRTGIGKTNLSLHMAYCLATGQPFYGFDCETTTVAYFAFEGAGRNYVERITKIEKTFPPTEDRLYFDVIQPFNPVEMYEDLIHRLGALKGRGCKVVILDSTKYIVPGDYLKPSDVKDFIQLLREHLVKLGMVAVLTLPIRKPPDGRSLFDPSDVYRIKGATEYVDSATSVLLLEKRPRAPMDNVALHFAKHRIATNQMYSIDMDFDRDKCAFERAESINGIIVNGVIVESPRS